MKIDEVTRVLVDMIHSSTTKCQGSTEGEVGRSLATTGSSRVRGENEIATSNVPLLSMVQIHASPLSCALANGWRQNQ